MARPVLLFRLWDHPGIDPALRTLADEGDKRYAEVFELVHRRQADRPNEIWQADHTSSTCGWSPRRVSRPGRG